MEAERIVVQIPGEPYALKRARVRVIKGAKQTFASHYDPKENRSWKGYAATFLSEAMVGLELFSGPIEVEIFAAYSMPKSRWLSTRNRPGHWKVTKPDVDNIIKAVLDAASGVVFMDDKQVVSISARKLVQAQGLKPYLSVSFRVMGEY